jgi:hypothetical protein
MLKFDFIRDFKKTVLKTEDRLPLYAKKALQARSEELKAMNREQLMSGRDSMGKKLPDYSATSVNVFGKPKGPIKLYDTGDFQDSIKPKFDKEAFSMEATDKKTEKLQYDYGDEILGISTTNLDEVADDSIPQIEYQIKQQFKI